MVMAFDERVLSVVVTKGILYSKFRFKTISFLRSEMAITTSDLPKPDAILQFLLQTNGSLQIVRYGTSNVSRQRNRRWT